MYSAHSDLVPVQNTVLYSVSFHYHPVTEPAYYSFEMAF